MSAIILIEIYAAEVEEFEPGEEVKSIEQTNRPNTKRAEAIVKYLKPPAFGRKPASDNFANPGEIKEYELEENEIQE